MTASQTPATAQVPEPDAAETGHAGRFDRVPGFGRPTARFVYWWTVALLAANVGIVATGGAVRLTGSGLGCPTWPRCTDDSFVPHGALGVHGVIEFGNRMLTWVLTIIAIGAFIAVLRYARSVRRDKWLVTLLALGIPFQGVIGGITVLTKLNPWVVALHFVLSMVLVSGATVLVYRLRPNSAPPQAAGPRIRLGRQLAWLQYLVTWAVIYLGTVVTGSGPHAGDTEAPRNGLAPDHATQLHADAVFVLIGLAVAITVFARVLQLPERRTAYTFVGLLTLQGVIGVVQYNTGLPIVLVIAHMAVSALLLITATWLILQFTMRTSAADDIPADAVEPTAGQRWSPAGEAR
ncbi:COX15/CtaA family protein [Gordonia insulae]|uniref:Heme A synthase n=1 Tax=Gordonia insulae TaxID=2420509 RepID=A0A3G8JGW5_9ACTN|nr:COX15/CtaA family protein [Gordonia insulae]AZG44316.1 Heme A synthase [Gordonia insulae]